MQNQILKTIGLYILIIKKTIQTMVLLLQDQKVQEMQEELYTQLVEHLIINYINYNTMLIM